MRADLCPDEPLRQWLKTVKAIQETNAQQQQQQPNTNTSSSDTTTTADNNSGRGATTSRHVEIPSTVTAHRRSVGRFISDEKDCTLTCMIRAHRPTYCMALFIKPAISHGSVGGPGISFIIAVKFVSSRKRSAGRIMYAGKYVETFTLLQKRRYILRDSEFIVKNHRLTRRSMVILVR